MKTIQTNQTGNNSQTFVSVCLASCQRLAAQIERVKENVLTEFRETFAANGQLLNHVLNEADALAWQTDYPHLFFPALAMEKVQAAASWKARQDSLRRHEPVYALAA